ncbi:hypothetical protein [Hafnia paralvei]|uniref:hypothetical protein n=1 Tax=Hafnia paralvei TaxID=546367 RepID=UPI00210A48A0|nr:hypothetical protein [Hafnia paralvei]MCQ4171710.1 hypothetical protein [Hafnia paralvei]
MQARDIESCSNAEFVSALIRAESVVASLSARGITITGIILRQGQPVIRIARHAYCEHMARTGKASYLHFGRSIQGEYRQGIFIQDGCKVIWSESLH